MGLWYGFGLRIDSCYKSLYIPNLGLSSISPAFIVASVIVDNVGITSILRLLFDIDVRYAILLKLSIINDHRIDGR